MQVLINAKVKINSLLSFMLEIPIGEPIVPIPILDPEFMPIYQIEAAFPRSVRDIMKRRATDVYGNLHDEITGEVITELDQPQCCHIDHDRRKTGKYNDPNNGFVASIVTHALDHEKQAAIAESRHDWMVHRFHITAVDLLVKTMTPRNLDRFYRLRRQ
jgi:hypothetical protein